MVVELSVLAVKSGEYLLVHVSKEAKCKRQHGKYYYRRT